MTEPRDPYAPPPEGWTPPQQQWGGGAGWPGAGWPGTPPPRATPFARDAVLAGLPLLLAAFLTASTAWAGLFTLLHRAIRGDDFFDDVAPEDTTFLEDWWPAVTMAILAVAAIGAWVSFAVLVRARRPDPITLLPYGLLGGLAGLVLGMPVVQLVGDAVRPR